MKTPSATQRKAQIKAIQFGENLMPCDCMDILIEVYGELRLEKMLPSTITDKVMGMMCAVSDDDNDIMIENCNLVVYEWLCDY